MDIAGIKRRAKYAPVYFVMDGKKISQIILPVHGKGLWSTLYGFISLDSETRIVKGIGFYQHGETPGLGGEVDNPAWKASWNGKVAFDESWNPQIEVIKGKVSQSTQGADHKIDGLSGATITSRGVRNIIHYWLGQDGFGPFLTKFRERIQGGNNG